MINWKKADGRIVTTNDLPASIAEAEKVGWSRVEKPAATKPTEEKAAKPAKKKNNNKK